MHQKKEDEVVENSLLFPLHIRCHKGKLTKNLYVGLFVEMEFGYMSWECSSPQPPYYYFDCDCFPLLVIKSENRQPAGGMEKALCTQGLLCCSTI